MSDWINRDGYPVVYICGICSQEGHEGARAGFGIDWGPNVANNTLSKGGSAIGQKSELRAELSAVITVINAAIEHEFPTIAIRHRSSKLEQELKALCSSTTFANSLNVDLLNEIKEKSSNLIIKIEKARTKEAPGFDEAILYAKRVAGMHSTAAVPISDEFYEDGYRIIDIHGSDGLGMIAGYGVYWGAGDSRNQQGTIEGQQTAFRAYFTACYHALETAASSNITDVIIRSRSRDVHAFFTKRTQFRRHQDLIEKLRIQLRGMKVIHWVCPKERSPEAQEAAIVLAKQISRRPKTHVSIYGMETSDDRIARYGIYWAPGDIRNKQGWMGGTHEQLCVLIKALKDAIEIGLVEYDQEVTVYTNCDLFKVYLNDRLWNDANWSPDSGHFECFHTNHVLSSLLDRLTVTVKDGHEGFVDAARELAMSVRGCQLVRTYGSIQFGNNEPVVKYGMFWSDDDAKNETGCIDGEQLTARAKQTAIIKALECALQNNISKLVIQSDLLDHEGVDEMLHDRINMLACQMEYVSFEENDTPEFEDFLKKT